MPDLSDESPSPSPQTFQSRTPVSHHYPLSIETPTPATSGGSIVTSLGGGGTTDYLQSHHVATSSLLIPDYSYTTKGLNGASDFSRSHNPSHLNDYVKPAISDNTFRPFLPSSTTSSTMMEDDPYKLPGGVGSHTDWHSSLYSTYPAPHHPPPKLTPSPFISNYLHSGY